MNTLLIEQRVTLICELGCARVREVIVALQRGGTTPETERLSDQDRLKILHELQAIMAVYDARP